jgi:myosin heavy chain 9/10/11/14
MRWYVSVYILFINPHRYEIFFSINNQQTDESQLQSAKRRAERETVDYKQRVLGFVFFFFSTFLYVLILFYDTSLERELERLHNRLERPASSMERTSPTAVDPSRK